MLVHSWSFLFAFLPLAALGYFVLQAKGGPGAARLWIIAASLLFYASSSPQHLPLLLGSIACNQALANAMAAAPQGTRRRRLLQLGLALNIGLLVFFKYAESLFGILGPGLPADGGGLRLALPLGISFYTLQQVAYLMDVYEGLAAPLGLLDHARFVTFFPHIMAGPIVRLRQMQPQYDDPARHGPDWDNVAKGVFLLVLGLFKKVVLADSLARLVANGFDAAPALSLVEAWFASIGFTLQLYFDFSGYVDIVTGAALFFNIQLPRNFDSPLQATNIIDFWRRWHISLSNFITTYIYTPIVRNWGRITFAKSLAAVVITMCIAGAWHGAAWTFVVFGLLHGLGLAANHIWRKRKVKLPRLLGWLLTIQLVNVSLVFFRARDFGSALKVLRGMAGQTGMTPGGIGLGPLLRLDPLQFDKIALFSGLGYLDVVLGLSLFVCGLGGALLLRNNDQRLAGFRPGLRAALLLAGCLFLCLVFMNSFTEVGFVYREF